jgi:hypothetical protein
VRRAPQRRRSARRAPAHAAGCLRRAREDAPAPLAQREPHRRRRDLAARDGSWRPDRPQRPYKRRPRP